MTKAQHADLTINESGKLLCQGNWDIHNFPFLKQLLNKVKWPKVGEVTFDGSDIEKLDSAGALLLSKWQKNLEKKGINVSFDGFSEEYQDLINLIKKEIKDKDFHPKLKLPTWVYQLGKNTTDAAIHFNQYLAFIGHLTLELLRVTYSPRRWRINAIAHTVYVNGFQALPIIAILSFMIGVVITYQMGLQLRSYGANIYIVDLLGLAMLREFGPLITAIMVAGRTGSAFTAQLGMMKLNQEIDALNTLGVTPAEILILPRILGLLIALPLLTMWSNIFGVIGGMIMANGMLDVTFYDFLSRFPRVIPLRALIIGLGKTPIFALIIASIGCFQGIQVENSAESVGRNTTRSVVLAIFFIIVADALFSVILSKLNL